MKRRIKPRLPSLPAEARVISIPLDDLIEEVLEKLPRPLKVSGRKRGKNAYAMLALFEGLLALSEYFDQIEAKRNVWRSDLVFRFHVIPGVKGRAAEAEEESRAIDQVLKAAVRSAGL